jgi:hypothetical protein
VSVLDLPDRVCGSIDCDETDDVQVVETVEHGERALCRSHREDLRVNGGIVDGE